MIKDAEVTDFGLELEKTPVIITPSTKPVSDITQKIIDRVRTDQIGFFNTVCSVDRKSAEFAAALAEELDLNNFRGSGSSKLRQIRSSYSWDATTGIVLVYGPRPPQKVSPFIRKLETWWEIEIPEIIAIDDKPGNSLFTEMRERGLRYRCLTTPNYRY